ncbi:MAG TPA: TetR/AcrR family transcriptional regulator [Actinomycetes bacterium]|nr:TetR/AcrR family transcriptional regulator [Actinomycetes bacterium]
MRREDEEGRASDGDHAAADPGPRRAGARYDAAVRAGRPRDARAHQAILDATVALLESTGYARITIEAIAARAGVGKTTIYRRWRSKGPLISEAISARLRLGPVPDTGDLRGDLGAFLSAVLAAFTTPAIGRSLPGLAGDLPDDADLAATLRSGIIDPERTIVTTILERARARGDLRPEADPELVLDLLVGPMLWRALMTREPLDATLCDRIVTHVTRAISRTPTGDAPTAR